MHFLPNEYNNTMEIRFNIIESIGARNKTKQGLCFAFVAFMPTTTNFLYSSSIDPDFLYNIESILIIRGRIKRQNEPKSDLKSLKFKG